MYEYGEKMRCIFRAGGTFKLIYLEIVVHKVPWYYHRGIIIWCILLGKEVSFLNICLLDQFSQNVIMVAYGNLITALQPSFCSFCVADNLLDTLLNENFIISHSISPLLVSGVQLAYQVHVPTITVSS